MHMNDALISASVALPLIGVAAGAIVMSCYKVQQEVQVNSKLVVMMAVLGAFVFAVQMVNFAIPGTGASGHMAGSILLSALLGPFAGFVVISSVLIIQALFFADGGLLALGANIVNVGLIPCFLIYPLIWWPLTSLKAGKLFLFIASITAGVLMMVLGATGIAVMTHVSGITHLPLVEFLALIVPIHLVIGLFEGVITATILHFALTNDDIKQFRPMLSAERQSRFTSVMLLCSLIVGGMLSLFASGNPDGMEWTVEKMAHNSLITFAPEPVNDVQQSLSFFSDYDLNGKFPVMETSMAGIFGSVCTLVFIMSLFYLIKFISKRDN
ncbi:energy-coupling factor ABC transporter permease [Vibrio alfacsensis]|uniref:energy-coupling factor ABC transporter permease n=1 Tax=Vibrio TaxID=662 RepID=UPI00406978D0